MPPNAEPKSRNLFEGISNKELKPREPTPGTPAFDPTGRNSAHQAKQTDFLVVKGRGICFAIGVGSCMQARNQPVKRVSPTPQLWAPESRVSCHD